MITTGNNMITTIALYRNQLSFDRVAKEGFKITLSVTAGGLAGAASGAVIYVMHLATSSFGTLASEFTTAISPTRILLNRQLELRMISNVVDTDPVRMRLASAIGQIGLSLAVGGFTAWHVGERTYNWLTELLG
jgi:hypothetical protein